MKKEMFINAQRHECRIAIVTDGALTELYTERASSLSQVGNIYKGRVTNVEASIQAAFVDFGKAKNGFLHISDLHPTHFPKGQNEVEAVGRKRARRDRPPIQSCLRRGDEVIVQVIKEGIGTKGATLTTYLSIPGRYLVLMPGMYRLGVSRKIEDEITRSHLRAILEELQPPEDLGFIVRTAGLNRAKQDLQRDLHYLLRLWKAVEQRSREAKAPAELYQESDLVIRTVRDVYNTDIQRIVCDDEAVACKIREFLLLTMPRSPHRVEVYQGDIGLFHAFGLEQEMEKINSPRVPLPGGGSLVIDQTEALVAIDVNSGRFRQTDNAETTALRINTEAAREVARQLRLRDLGGVVVIDFIDMAEEKHRRQIERMLRDEVDDDRAKTKILKMSRFGIVEMTRQRVRPSLTSSIFRPCPHCAGSGRIKSEESQALAEMRTLSLAADDERVARIELSVPPAVADHILNMRRDDLARIEQAGAARIAVHADATLPGGEFRIACSDARGLAIQWDASSALASHAKHAVTREISDADQARFRTERPAEPTEEPAETAAATTPVPAPALAPPPAPPAQPVETPAGEAQAQPRKSRRHRGGRRRSRGRRRQEGSVGGSQQPGQQPPPTAEAAPPAPSRAPARPPQPATAPSAPPQDGPVLWESPPDRPAPSSRPVEQSQQPQPPRTAPVRQPEGPVSGAQAGAQPTPGGAREPQPAPTAALDKGGKPKSRRRRRRRGRSPGRNAPKPNAPPGGSPQPPA